MSSAWFHKLWSGAGAVWSWGLLALFLFSLWSVGSLVVHHFQGAGMNGVYEASDGAGEMTFWNDGTYLMTSMGMRIPGKYRLRNNGTVDMAAQFDALTHPAPSAADQGANAFLGLLASGMGEGVVSADKNTFQWQGTTYSYDHKPTTGPPVISDPSASQAGMGGSSNGASIYQPPTSEQLQRSQPKAGDPFQTNTTTDPDSDPAQTMRRVYQNTPGAGQ